MGKVEEKQWSLDMEKLDHKVTKHEMATELLIKTARKLQHGDHADKFNVKQDILIERSKAEDVDTKD